MTTTRMLGALMLIGGVVLLIVGMNSSHSMADQLSNTFTGRFTQATTWYIVTGATVGVVGLWLLLAGVLRKVTPTNTVPASPTSGGSRLR